MGRKISMIVTVKFNSKTNNIKIQNSYFVERKDEMIKFLSKMDLELIDRSITSCLNEWIAHNRLYKLGIFKSRCKDCDLSANESLFRRIWYWILSR